jgi:hypothetical protein
MTLSTTSKKIVRDALVVRPFEMWDVHLNPEAMLQLWGRGGGGDVPHPSTVLEKPRRRPALARERMQRHREKRRGRREKA